jgi:acetyl-CoA carboxylase alpha subunit
MEKLLERYLSKTVNKYQKHQEKFDKKIQDLRKEFDREEEKISNTLEEIAARSEKRLSVLNTILNKIKERIELIKYRRAEAEVALQDARIDIINKKKTIDQAFFGLGEPCQDISSVEVKDGK